jgi:sRNA-binding protein
VALAESKAELQRLSAERDAALKAQASAEGVAATHAAAATAAASEAQAVKARLARTEATVAGLKVLYVYTTVKFNVLQLHRFPFFASILPSFQKCIVLILN